MAVSNQSVLHFTKNLDTLKKILKENAFRFAYCSENFKFNENENLKTAYDIAVPMVSFCDIPFNQINGHVLKYGEYGIGLGKYWAVAKKLNPVLYVEMNSELAYSLRQLHATLKKSGGNGTNAIPYVHDILGYIKNCSGSSIRNNQLITNNFYDEREWRLVEKNLPLLVGEDYEVDKDKYNAEAFEKKLPFDFDDIKYIVLKEESEVSTFIQFLKSICNSQIEQLCRKIITVEQIKRDF